VKHRKRIRIQMSAKAIEIRDLTRRYGYRVALRKISLDFSEKGIQGLFGSNGAGKTTLLRVISTLLRPHGGTIIVMGFNPQEEPEEVKKFLGLVGDKPLLYNELTGIENLRFYSKLYGLRSDFFESQVEELSQRFAIKTWLEEPVKNLSTGLKKRLDIVRSLIHNPELLLLDEPFSGLDKDTTEDFQEYLNEFRNIRTTIVTTHNLAFGAELCDEFVTLRKGVVVSQGPISEFDQTL
jgi:heme exporter protein A